MHRPALLLSCLALAFSASAAPAESGRRKSEKDVKRGVDVELQKKIDQAVEKARNYLLDGCAGSGLTKARIEQLESQIKSQLATVKDYRKQAEDMKGKDDAKSAQMEQFANSFEQSIKSTEDQIKTLRQSLDRKKGMPAAPLYESLQYKMGEEALIGLALVQSGVSPYDPVVQQIWKDQYSQPMPTDHVTYAVSLQLMLADAMMHAPCGDPWPEGGPQPRQDKKDKKDAKLSKEAQPDRDEVLSWIQKRTDALGVSTGGAWSYTLNAAPPPAKGYTVDGGGPEIGSAELVKMVMAGGHGDYSNTQYAVLGLKAAALCGVRPPDADMMWRKVIQQFLLGQEATGKEVTLLLEAEGQNGKKGHKEKAKAKEKDKEPGFMKGFEEVETGGKKRKAKVRGWSYMRNQNPAQVMAGTATMTAAGLTAVLVGRSELRLTPKERDQVDESVRDGLAWVQENWGQIMGAGASNNGYMLYGLERMGVLGALRTVGGHDWYVEGAKALVQSQKADGSWDGGYSSPVGTSFCLLFLTLGTREEYAKPSYRVDDFAPLPPKPLKTP